VLATAWIFLFLTPGGFSRVLRLGAIVSLQQEIVFLPETFMTIFMLY
jgi:hypothetical protein